MWYLIVSIPDLCTLTYFYFNNVMLTLHKVRLMSQKPCKHTNKCDCSKQTVINEVYVFTIRYRFSDILLKNTKTSFILLVKLFWLIRKIDFNRAEPTFYRPNFPYASSVQQNSATSNASYVHLMLDSILQLCWAFPIEVASSKKILKHFKKRL